MNFRRPDNVRVIRTRVASIIPEAPRCNTLRLDLEGSPLPFKAGQAIIIDAAQFEALRPKLADQAATRRYFSISSSPHQTGAIEITVKGDMNGTEESPLTEYLLTQIKLGDRVELDGPAGRFTLPDPLPAGVEGVVYICAGSGVAPVRGILRWAIARKLPLRHALFLQNRTLADILYKREWDSVKDHVKVVHALSEPPEHWSGARGYITAELLRKELAGTIDPARALAFVCGPNYASGGRPGFLETFAGLASKKKTGVLAELGVPSDRIITELG